MHDFSIIMRWYWDAAAEAAPDTQNRIFHSRKVSTVCVRWWSRVRWFGWPVLFLRHYKSVELHLYISICWLQIETKVIKTFATSSRNVRRKNIALILKTTAPKSNPPINFKKVYSDAFFVSSSKCYNKAMRENGEQKLSPEISLNGTTRGTRRRRREKTAWDE